MVVVSYHELILLNLLTFIERLDLDFGCALFSPWGILVILGITVVTSSAINRR